MSTPVFSIIVPAHRLTPFFLNFTLPAIAKQTVAYELILILDSQPNQPLPNKHARVVVSGPIGPAQKRQLAAKTARGRYLAFLDDDAYPSPEWLAVAFSALADPHLAAVCGPGVTPPTDSTTQKIAGCIWGSWLGAGGAGVYRSVPQSKRFVDDYPTFNLILKKASFFRVGGFDTNFWPGEDTKLCHDLVYNLHQKIAYLPSLLVYHSRRPIGLPFLVQIARYGRQRGYFTKILPQTSLRLGYFIPSLFLGFLVFTVTVVVFGLIPSIYQSILTLVLVVYAALACFSALTLAWKHSMPLIAVAYPPMMLLTHLTYGIAFVFGLTGNGLRR